MKWTLIFLCSFLIAPYANAEVYLRHYLPDSSTIFTPISEDSLKFLEANQQSPEFVFQNFQVGDTSIWQPIRTLALLFKADKAEADELPVPRILRAIAYCESHDAHYDAKGKVLRGRVNRNDIGRYQINLKHWGDEAKELGYDLFDENENELMALWIYKNYGDAPWIHSKTCWKKLTR